MAIFKDLCKGIVLFKLCLVGEDLKIYANYNICKEPFQRDNARTAGGTYILGLINIVYYLALQFNCP